MTDRHQRTPLAVSAIAAVLASTCCLGPLLLVSLGISGAWIGNLSKLEPFRPVTLLVAVVSLALAYRRLWTPARECEPGEVCAVPVVRRVYKLLFILIAALTILGFAFPFLAPLFY